MNHSSWVALLGGAALTMIVPACGSGPHGGRGSNAGGIATIGGGGTDGSAGAGGGAGDGSGGQGSDGGTGAGGTADGSDSGGDVFGDDTELIFLEVTPADVVLELDLDEAGSQTFYVIGHYSDGSTSDLSDQASWVVDNPAVGSMSGTTLDVTPHSDTFFDSTVVTAKVDDFNGQAQLTLATYHKTGANQDFFFVLPYQDPAGNQSKPLTFSTDVQSLDVFFNVDTTGSMTGPINNLQSSLVTIISDIQTQISDSNFGVASFEDYPFGGYGQNPCSTSGQPDQPFDLKVTITNTVAVAQNGVNQLSLGPGGLPIGCGADTPEANIEALFQVATGNGLTGPGATNVPSNAVGIGGVGFRDGALPVVVSVTDAVAHDTENNNCGQQYSGSVASVAASKTDALDALQGICARVVPVAVGNFDTGCGPLADGIQFAEATGAVIPPEAWDLAPGGRPPGCGSGQCCTGLNSSGVGTNGAGMCPLVYRANTNGSGLDTGITDGVQMLAQYAPFDVTTEVDGQDADVDGVALPAGVTTADFIAAVTPSGHGVVPVPGVPDPTLTPTSFENVIPATDVTFDIEAYNDIVPAGPTPRLFEATIRVLASGCSDLDQREVFILVPPAPLPPPG